MITQSIQKLLNTMARTKETVATKQEGVDTNLIVNHNEYLENALDVNWMKVGVINHLDTQ